MTLNKSKQNTNQNLIPNKLLYTYLYQRTLVPAIIVVIAVLFLSAGVYFGCNWLIEDYNQRALELASQDLTASNAASQELLDRKTAEKEELAEEYNNYYRDNPINVVVDESRINNLNLIISDLKYELEMWENKQDTPVETPVDVNEKYHIEDLILYIDKIRTKNLAIVSIEDSKSENSGKDVNYLIYDEDVGKVSFSLHGMATSTQELSKFMVLLNECEYIEYTKVVSIETQTVESGPSIYVFEIIITPKVN